MAYSTRSRLSLVVPCTCMNAHISAACQGWYHNVATQMIVRMTRRIVGVYLRSFQPPHSLPYPSSVLSRWHFMWMILAFCLPCQNCFCFALSSCASLHWARSCVVHCSSIIMARPKTTHLHSRKSSDILTNNFGCLFVHADMRLPPCIGIHSITRFRCAATNAKDFTRRYAATSQNLSTATPRALSSV